MTQKPSADYLMPMLLTEHVPATISLIILLLVFSASMSSLSSLVLVSASSVAIDLYAREASPKPSSQQTMLVMRLLCGVFILLSLGIALYRPAFILSLMVISWGAIGGSFIAPYVYGLFWEKGTKEAAIVSLLGGMLTAICLYVAWGEGGVPLAGALAIVVPLVLYPLVTLATARSTVKTEEIAAEEHSPRLPTEA